MTLNTRVFFRDNSGVPATGLVGATVEIKNLDTDSVVGTFPLTEDTGGIYFYNFSGLYNPAVSYQAYFTSGTGLTAVEVISGYQDLILLMKGSGVGGGGGGGGLSDRDYERFLKAVKEALEEKLSNIEIELPSAWDAEMKNAVVDIKDTIAKIEVALEQHGEDYVQEATELRKSILSSIKDVVSKLETPIVNIPKSDMSGIVKDVTEIMKNQSMDIADSMIEMIKKMMTQVMKLSLTEKEEKALKKKFKKDLEGMFDTTNKKQ